VADGGEEFEGVFRALLPRAHRVAFRILGDDRDAEDAAAEAFARAHASWRRVGRLPYRDAWILRVTANVAIDLARKRRPLPVATIDVEHEDVVVLHVTLLAALAALPRRQREVVTLRFLEDLSEADIARVLHVSVGTVKKTTHRAMAALRERLGADWDVSLRPPRGEAFDATV